MKIAVTEHYGKGENMSSVEPLGVTVAVDGSDVARISNVERHGRHPHAAARAEGFVDGIRYATVGDAWVEWNQKADSERSEWL